MSEDSSVDIERSEEEWSIVNEDFLEKIGENVQMKYINMKFEVYNLKDFITFWHCVILPCLFYK